MNLNKVPKQFCDNVLAARAKEYFVVGMLVGEAGTFYSLTPQHFKRLVQSLSHQLAGYEKEHGTIDTAWVPGVKSPIQTQDLKEGEGEK
ncbi:hypothetical protein A2943_02415 [Candidatus Adlerbacteria bacterium RIFCSPLOWO2_01_FULL_51_16]|uniref:Uncharacterized protein n=1 Tax=Candidatus Adlerbacteria bacterium RIFCSPLOWO2_01_FULL_51_16 TaxID=1797243 RepID=A0A1F4XGA6_9BACT|nr:MAG: hypothetical protein A2943_02415 [Candidatus Adlerbacteria bacterium RIFCSPLOWO2_01_FULL_51_16]